MVQCNIRISGYYFDHSFRIATTLLTAAVHGGLPPRGHPRCAAFVEPLLPRLATRMYADNVELSEPLTSVGAITKSVKHIAEVQACSARVRHSDKHHAVRASTHCDWEAIGRAR